MMSALAMILTAAMMVPGDGPERVSGELAKPQRLDLSGEWKGQFTYGDRHATITLEGKMSGSIFVVMPQEIQLIDLGPERMTDEGNGRFSLRRDTKAPEAPDYLGIYKHEGDRVTICYRLTKYGRPSKFKFVDSCRLLILHRVKSNK
jgi:hypothetical protein